MCILKALCAALWLEVYLVSFVTKLTDAEKAMLESFYINHILNSGWIPCSNSASTQNSSSVIITIGYMSLCFELQASEFCKISSHMFGTATVQVPLIFLAAFWIKDWPFIFHHEAQIVFLTLSWRVVGWRYFIFFPWNVSSSPLAPFNLLVGRFVLWLIVFGQSILMCPVLPQPKQV